MNRNIGYWIIGAAFFVQVLFVPWESFSSGRGGPFGWSGPSGWNFYGYLPLFTGRGMRLDVERLAIQLLITALIAVGYTYVTRENREG